MLQLPRPGLLCRMSCIRNLGVNEKSPTLSKLGPWRGRGPTTDAAHNSSGLAPEAEEEEERGQRRMGRKLRFGELLSLVK